MKKNIHIQIMQLSDFDELYSMWEKTGLNPLSKEIERREFSMMLGLNPSTCFVCEDNDKIIGSVMGIFNGRSGWIYHLAIDSDFQEMGIGTELLKMAEEALQKAGATNIRAWVYNTNLEVLPFYQKQDYHVIDNSIVVGKDFVNRL